MKWSRRRWIAEFFSCDMSEVEEYQRPKDHGGVPLFQIGGNIIALVMPGDNTDACKTAMGDRKLRIRTHWKDPAVAVWTEAQ